MATLTMVMDAVVPVSSKLDLNALVEMRLRPIHAQMIVGMDYLSEEMILQLIEMMATLMRMMGVTTLELS